MQKNLFKKEMQMVRKFLLFLILISMIPFFSNCGGKYDDVVSMNDQFVEVMEDYLQDLDKADSPKAVAAAMNDFADKMEDLGPKLKEMAQKYPELNDPKNLPDELRANQKKAEELGQRMAGSMMKMMQFMTSPEVQAAQQRMAQSMGSMK